MKEKRVFRNNPWWLVGFAGFLLGSLLLGSGVATQGTAAEKKPNCHEAYVLYQQKCLGCHLSVADPEKPGRTHDGWYLVVKVMHKRGLELTDAEAQAIVEYLYHLRKGLETEPG